MQITIFGAGGRVGSRAVELALKRGYKVVAFVHSQANFVDSPNLKVVQGDARNQADVEKALAGSEAVISALASWGTPTKDILTSAVKNIIPVCKQQNIARIISLTGVDARLPSDHPTLVNRLSRFALNIVSHKVIQDGENHLLLLMASDLNWTVVRSPVMTKSKATGYKLSLEITPPWQTVSYSAVACSLIDLIENHNFDHQSPFIAS